MSMFLSLMWNAIGYLIVPSKVSPIHSANNLQICSSASCRFFDFSQSLASSNKNSDCMATPLICLVSMLLIAPRCAILSIAFILSSILFNIPSMLCPPGCNRYGLSPASVSLGIFMIAPAPAVVSTSGVTTRLGWLVNLINCSHSDHSLDMAIAMSAMSPTSLTPMPLTGPLLAYTNTAGILPSSFTISSIGIGLPWSSWLTLDNIILSLVNSLM